MIIIIACIVFQIAIVTYIHTTFYTFRTLKSERPGIDDGFFM